MQDAWRAYLELAMGLTEAPRKKAQDAVMRVVGQGGATAAQIQTLAEELVATGLANRESLTKLVRFEVDRALGAVGLATADEVAELTRRVHDLERQLREARGNLGPGETSPAGASEPAAPTGAAAAPSGAAAPQTEPSSAEPSSAEPSPAAPSGAGQPKAAAGTPATTQTKAVAKKTVAKKAIAKKPPATMARTPADGSPAAPARPAKKATGRRADGS
ncbi:hypothetical protein ACIA8B_31435 [Micromonospora chalcea]|uniref:phasin family protein n=1 Tax=Micromonospora sp. TSRI0369 TaxID=1703936 RepID=UPI00093C0A30|nr:hypothetical protein [Micromonospora sp. TSRI0369]OKJ34687.1 hypothetical protein AMK25_29375 [Micromonospora sp. TSRI0369]